MTANVITFRGRSAMREIGKALNFPPTMSSIVSRAFRAAAIFRTRSILQRSTAAGRDFRSTIRARAAALAALPADLRTCRDILGQHSGGMIICQGAAQFDRPAGKRLHARPRRRAVG